MKCFNYQRKKKIVQKDTPVIVAAAVRGRHRAINVNMDLDDLLAHVLILNLENASHAAAGELSAPASFSVRNEE